MACNDDYKELEAAAQERGWTVACRFPIYRLDWEMDNAGVVARDQDGAVHLLTTMQGVVCIDKENVEDLKKYRSQAEEWLAAMDAAIERTGG